MQKHSAWLLLSKPCPTTTILTTGTFQGTVRGNPDQREMRFSISRPEEEGPCIPGLQADADSSPTVPRPPGRMRALCCLKNLSLSLVFYSRSDLIESPKPRAGLTEVGETRRPLYNKWKPEAGHSLPSAPIFPQVWFAQSHILEASDTTSSLLGRWGRQGAHLRRIPALLVAYSSK